MMSNRKLFFVSGLVFVVLVLVGCTGNPNPLPTGATPIPTLIPATLPAAESMQESETLLVVESYPLGEPSAESGQVLYLENCAECHGEDGSGVVSNARDFTDVDYMRGESPAAFYTAVSEGHGAVDSDMPAFGLLLSSDQRWDVVYYIWRISVSDEMLLAGQDIYNNNCVTCHGPTGQSMILGAANFSDHEFLSNMAPSQLFVSVTQGKGSMPSWQARLSQEDRWSALEFVRTFNYNPVLPAAEGEEVEEGTVAFVPEEEVVVEKPECDASYLEMTNPFTLGDADAVAAGALVFEDQCLRCHGEDGTGAEGLSYIPPDLTSELIQTTIRENAGEYFCRLNEGLTEMPSFARQLEADQMWQALTFVATLGE
ncbi:MAG: c-type cytochrome [Chloroflexi bacterium]|nr:c-type cytochrome [Chloroflexota bacterium]